MVFVPRALQAGRRIFGLRSGRHHPAGPRGGGGRRRTGGSSEKGESTAAESGSRRFYGIRQKMRGVGARMVSLLRRGG